MSAADARNQPAPTRQRILDEALLKTLTLVAAMLVALTTHAQRTDDNAVTAADDAFGNTVGFQTIGLYSPTNARGFNPTQAENLRIEGLYFDQQTSASNPFLFSGSEMRVGIAAQSYSFPSPTGIADFKLRTPGDVSLVSAVFTRGPLNMSTVEIDAQYPLIKDTVSAGLTVANWTDFDDNYARSSGSKEFSLILRIRPNTHAEIVPFVGYVHNGEHQILPTVFGNGIDPLPLFNEQRLAAQNWSSWGWNQLTAGIIERSSLGNSWKLTAGLFRSEQQQAQNFNDLLLGLMPNGVADHVMDVTPPLRAGSYSGDLRLAWQITDGAHARELTLAVRGRQVARNFGGDSITDLGATSIYQRVSVTEPVLKFSDPSKDNVRQTGVGVSYNERWRGVGTLSLGVLKTDYSRTIANSGMQTSPEHSSQVLPTASVTVDAGRHLTMYASYTRGLEDSAGAPPSAVNRGEPPPAAPTWQADGGVRIAPRRGVQVLLGAFEVHKAYFNLDSAGRYEQLGNISSRGVEGSATVNSAAGLKVVAGIVLLKPEVERRSPALGGEGTVPVGPVPRTININVDYAPASWGRWAAAAQWSSLSSRVEVNNDHAKLPPLSTLNLSARYKLSLLHRPCSVRLDAANVTNATGLTISPLFAVFPQLRRNYTLTVAADI
jgi:iron complex outermembrane receptor protein